MRLRVAFFGIALLACTGGSLDPTPRDGGASSSSSSSSSSSGGSVATPQAIFEGRLEQTNEADGGVCAEIGALKSFGTFGDPAASVASSPVKDKDAANGIVHIACSVKPSASTADAFDVEAAITDSEMGFTVSGTFKPAGEQSNIRVRITTRGRELAQSDKQCIGRYTTSFHGVAAGRVWAEIDCPSVTDADKTTCRAVAQFRFENCAQ